MAQAQRDFQLQQAQCDAAVSARKAQADLAYQLQVGGGLRDHPPSDTWLLSPGIWGGGGVWGCPLQGSRDPLGFFGQPGTLNDPLVWAKSTPK